VYHDVRNIDKLPEFVKQVYLERREVNTIGVPIMDPKKWIQGIYNTGIMNLLEILHFGKDKDVNNFVK